MLVLVAVIDVVMAVAVRFGPETHGTSLEEIAELPAACTRAVTVP